jgi:hypothetical protein
MGKLHLEKYKNGIGPIFVIVVIGIIFIVYHFKVYKIYTNTKIFSLKIYPLNTDINTILRSPNCKESKLSAVSTVISSYFPGSSSVVCSAGKTSDIVYAFKTSKYGLNSLRTVGTRYEERNLEREKINDIIAEIKNKYGKPDRIKIEKDDIIIEECYSWNEGPVHKMLYLQKDSSDLVYKKFVFMIFERELDIYGRSGINKTRDTTVFDSGKICLPRIPPLRYQ